MDELSSVCNLWIRWIPLSVFFFVVVVVVVVVVLLSIYFISLSAFALSAILFLSFGGI